MRHWEITPVLNVGANIGDYASALRQWGCKGKIISFEPRAEARRHLQAQAAHDALWEAHGTAIGERRACMALESAGTCSSLLPVVNPDLAPDHVEVRGEEVVEVVPLDDVRHEVYSSADRVWLKLDVQGFEAPVLAGASAALEDVSVVELELSVQPLYNGQSTYLEMIHWLQRSPLRGVVAASRRA